MLLRHLFLLTLFVFAPNAMADDPIGYEGVKKDDSNPVLREYASLTKNPDTTTHTKDGWIIVNLKKDHSVWFFAPSMHPAFPAYVKRQVVEKDGQVQMETKVLCGAPKVDCDTMVKSFMDVNNQIAREMQNR